MHRFKLCLLAAPLVLTGCSGSIESLTGYTASMLCSKVFVTGQAPATVFQEDLVKITNGTALFTRTAIQPRAQTTTSRLFGVTSKAVYRQGVGCTLVGDQGEAALRAQNLPDVPPAELHPDVSWPLGSDTSAPLPGFDYASVEQATEHHFTEHGDFQIKSSSFAVAYQGELIFEHYADGFAPDTPIYGFSLGKTLSAMMAGTMVKQGLLDMHAPTGQPEWQQDARAGITPHQLLTMTSGLAWSETYDQPTSDANLLFVMDDMASFASAKPLANDPGTTFNYSSGSSLILADVMKARLGGDLGGAYGYLQSQLLRPIGINNAVVQADASGTLVFGMQDLIGTHDLVRLGQLLLQDGEWQGRQILATGWVDYMSSLVPLPTNFGFEYGAGLWLNGDSSGREFLPSLPEDTLIAYGLRGQFLIIVPSLDLVIARTGNTLDMETLGLIPEIDALAATVVAALPE